MPNKHKICAHLHLEDGKIIDVPIKSRKLHDGSFRCTVTIKTNPLNEYITVCRNAIEQLKFDAPKQCRHPNCDCGELTAKFLL